MKLAEAIEHARNNAGGDVNIMFYQEDEQGGASDGTPSIVWNEIDGLRFDGTFYPSDILDSRNWTWMEV